MAGSATKTLLKEFKNFVAYPVQIEGGGTDGSPPSSISAGEVVDQALRQVLGARTRAADADGVRRALDRAFGDRGGNSATGTDTLVRRVAASNSELVGIQGSLLARAEDVVGQVDPLLDSLQSLRDNLGERDAHAISVVVRQALHDLRAELGRENGPRVSLVEQYWRVLLAFDTSNPPRSPDPNTIGGALGDLRDVLGLGPALPSTGPIDPAITTADEAPVTAFRLLADLITGLFAGWKGSVAYFRAGRQNRPFLGDSLQRLSLAAASVQDTVARVQAAFDSVYLSEADRRNLNLKLPGAPNELLTLQDLIEWAGQLVGPEATKLIQDGGRRAIGDYLRPNARRVARLLSQASKLQKPGPYSAPRVQAAMAELASQTHKLAKEFKRVAPAPPNPPSKKVTVPAVMGGNVGAVSTAITAAGLTVTTIAAYAPAAAGSVLSVVPAPGAKVLRGSPVVVTYSTGPIQIVVPNLSKRTLNDATNLLRVSGLAIGKITFQTGAKRSTGTVVTSTPAAGNAVAPGSFVDVEITP